MCVCVYIYMKDRLVKCRLGSHKAGLFGGVRSEKHRQTIAIMLGGKIQSKQLRQ